MHEWLTAASERLAAASGATDAELHLDDASVHDLLDLARVAAHESGERTNAPLVCYLVGLAQGRHGGDLGELVDAVVGKTV